MGIKLQKVFDVYASKKNLTAPSLKFLFDGQRLIGDMTPEALGEREREVKGEMDFDILSTFFTFCSVSVFT